MQKRGEVAVAGAGRYILGGTLCGVFCGRATLDFLGRGAFLCALKESLRNGHNQMDPRCSLEPAYEEDAATD